MQDAKDDDVPPFDAEKDFVGKTVRQDAAEIAIINRITFGIGFQPQEGLGVRGQKFVTQAGTLGFIPIVRAAEVGLGLGPDGDGPVHRLDLRICRKTSRQGSPGLRSFSNSANASSSACRSAGVGAPPSSRSASFRWATLYSRCVISLRSL